MSVLIQGMETPIFEHQSWDIRKGADGKWYMVDTNAETSDGVWHEIIRVPPHGRLIDADELLTSNCVGTQIAGWGKMYHETCIEYAPTVIPADKEE